MVHSSRKWAEGAPQKWKPKSTSARDTVLDPSPWLRKSSTMLTAAKALTTQVLKEHFQEKTGNAWVLRKNAGDADDSNTPNLASIYALYPLEQVHPTSYSSSSSQRHESTWNVTICAYFPFRETVQNPNHSLTKLDIFDLERSTETSSLFYDQFLSKMYFNFDFTNKIQNWSYTRWLI